VLQAGQERLARWQAGVARDRGPSGSSLVASVRAALADDLDTPGALRLVDDWCAAAGDDLEAPAHAAALVDRLLGVALLADPADAGPGSP